MTPTHEFDPQLLSEVAALPAMPGVYRYFDAEGGVLYVGKARNLKKRVSTYFQKSHGGTRIGLCLHRFNRDWSRRVLGQSATALLFTDGRNMAPIDYEGYHGCTRQDRRAAGACWRSSNMANLDEASLDRLTISACQVLQQTYGVEVYVVLVDMADEGVRQAATQCTGHADRVLKTEKNVAYARIELGRGNGKGGTAGGRA